MKPVRLSGHAREDMVYTGASEGEIIDAIRTSTWDSAKRGRVECRMDLPFNREWNGKLYTAKQVRPIFVDESDEIVVVTVYVYYF